MHWSYLSFPSVKKLMILPVMIIIWTSDVFVVKLSMEGKSFKTQWFICSEWKMYLALMYPPIKMLKILDEIVLLWIDGLLVFNSTIMITIRDSQIKNWLRFHKNYDRYRLVICKNWLSTTTFLMTKICLQHFMSL